MHVTQLALCPHVTQKTHNKPEYKTTSFVCVFPKANARLSWSRHMWSTTHSFSQGWQKHRWQIHCATVTQNVFVSINLQKKGPRCCCCEVWWTFLFLFEKINTRQNTLKASERDKLPKHASLWMLNWPERDKVGCFNMKWRALICHVVTWTLVSCLLQKLCKLVESINESVMRLCVRGWTICVVGDISQSFAESLKT